MRKQILIFRYAGWGLLLGITLLIGSLCAGGCEPYGVVAGEGVDTVSVALAQQFGGGHADLFLYRITSRKTGAYLGIGRRFPMRERGQVRAVLSMDQVPAGTPLLIHYMWINPDGKEVYTKEIYIRAEDWTDPETVGALKEARVSLDPVQGTVQMESRYGISPDRLDEQLHKPEETWTFKTGTWTVRTYLFRKKLLETTFELLPPE